MNVQKKVLKLSDFNGGIIDDLFQEEFDKVLENIADDNTSPKASREINIKITIKPDEARGFATTRIDVKSKLANVEPSAGSIALSFDGRRVSAFTSDPKQLELEPAPNVVNASDRFGGKLK